MGIPTGNGCFDADSDFVGVEALPVSAAALAASITIKQHTAKCYGALDGQESVTCSDPYTFTTNEVSPVGTIGYVCGGDGGWLSYYVNPATGAWMEQQ